MESGYEKLNLIRKKISLYVAAILLCFLSVIAYADSNVYAQEETGKRIGLNYSEVTMFPSQKVSLEVQGEVIKGDRVSKEEYYNRINEIEKHNGQEPWFASHALYNDFYYLEVSYSSDNEKVQVSDEGVIYADKDIVDVTTATITVNYKFYGWSYENEKTNIEASEKCSVIVDKGTILGDDIVASGLTSSYLLSSQYTIGEVKWSVDNEKVATLSSDGILTANVYGSVTITVTVTDGELENAITKVVRISDPKFKKSTEAIAVGGSYEVELTGVYDDSVKTYKSSKVKCVKVSEVGLVYVVKKTSKDVTITAIIDGRKITMTVKVTNPVFNRGDANPILLVKGKKLKLTVKGLVDGISKVKYSSDKTDIATVNKIGRAHV